MIRFFVQLKHRLQTPAITIYFNLLSIKGKIKWFFSQKYKVIKSEDLQDKKNIVLFAMYQKDVFRRDVINLLKTLKENNIYVIGVNTQKIKKDSIGEIDKYFDVYINRYNYGRDFGSYKLGFQKIIFQKLANRDFDRVLMINDSVFYSSKNLNFFVNEMLGSEFEVAGATENFDVQHHLGSFCIKMDKKIIDNKKFKKFWNSYVVNDVRPNIIKKGELGLSKCLKSCVTNEADFGAVFGSKLLMKKLIDENDKYLFSNIKALTRQNQNVHWKTFTVQDMFGLINQNIFNKYHIQNTAKSSSTNITMTGSDSSSEMSSINTISQAERDKSSMVFSLDDLTVFLRQNLAEFDEEKHGKDILEKIAHYWYLVFREGSQVHQNAALLLYFGCSIVKMDGTLRGFWTSKEIEPMADFMNVEDFSDLSQRLYSKNNLGESLIGWRHVAFLKGFI